MKLRPVVRWGRSLDSGWQRFWNREQRLVLVNAGLPIACIHALGNIRRGDFSVLAIVRVAFVVGGL